MGFTARCVIADAVASGRITLDELERRQLAAIAHAAPSRLLSRLDAFECELANELEGK